jgi:hypothetical protein
MKAYKYDLFLRLWSSNFWRYLVLWKDTDFSKNALPPSLGLKGVCSDACLCRKVLRGDYQTQGEGGKKGTWSYGKK